MTKKILLTLGILVIIALAVFWVMSRGVGTEQSDGRVGFSIGDFLPFGSDNNTDVQIDTNTTPSPDNTNTSTTTETNINTPVPKLRKISNEPVAGAVILERGTTSIVRFVEKGTGNVYEANSQDISIKRVTNTTIPKILRAFWLPDGSGFLAQTLDNYTELAETSFIKITPAKVVPGSETLTPSETLISKLPTGIRELKVSNDGKKIIYYQVTNNGSSWYVSNPDGTSANLIFQNPLSEWLIAAFDGKKALIQTKSSASTNGYTFELNISTKTLKKTGVGLVGLTLNPDYDFSPYLLSQGGNAPQLVVVNDKNSATAPLTTYTLADKCVWSRSKVPSIICGVPQGVPRGQYPDDWYKGVISTTDSIFKVDYINGVNSIISDLQNESTEKIDVVNPQISDNDNYLIFRNKIDGFLWMLNLK